MTEEQIESLANEFLDAHEVKRLPVDPFDLAGREQIRLLPGDYDGCFDARLEYRRTAGKGRFFLLYREEEFFYRSHYRTRFSIGHELGHFFLPHQRKDLLSGKYHNCRTDFVSDKQYEREADWFSAALLMPQRWFKDQVLMKNGGFCTLRNLADSSELFQTSLTSTAIRYAKLNFEACCVVLSQNNQVKCSWASQDMRDQGLGWLDWGSAIPRTSVTARLARSESYGQLVEDSIDTEVWFENRRSRRAWEEALVLGRTGLTLTFIAVEAEDGDDD